MGGAGEGTTLVTVPPAAFRIQAAAEYTGLGASTIRQLIRDGILPARKAGPNPRSPVLLLRLDLDHFLENLPLVSAS